MVAGLVVVALLLSLPGARKWILLAVGVLLITGAICWIFFTPVIGWTGGVSLLLRVTVLDGVSGSPVQNALVELWHEDDPPSGNSGRTTSGLLLGSFNAHGEGRVEFGYGFRAGGAIRWYGRTGTMHITGYWLKASAPGYRASRVKLSDFTGAQRSVRESRTVAIEMRLAKGEPSDVRP